MFQYRLFQFFSRFLFCCLWRQKLNVRKILKFIKHRNCPYCYKHILSKWLSYYEFALSPKKDNFRLKKIILSCNKNFARNMGLWNPQNKWKMWLTSRIEDHWTCEWWFTTQYWDSIPPTHRWRKWTSLKNFRKLLVVCIQISFIDFFFFFFAAIASLRVLESSQKHQDMSVLNRFISSYQDGRGLRI